MANPCILIARPDEDGIELSAVLAEHEIDALIEPMTHITTVSPDLSKLPAKESYQAVLMTSRNAVRSTTGLAPFFSLPLLTVGLSTALEAREKGFTTVMAAGGNAGDLLQQTLARFQPRNGALVYLRGQHIRQDLSAFLKTKGYDIYDVITYDAEAIPSLSETAQRALQDGTLSGAIFYSARQAKIFVQKVAQHKLKGATQKLAAFCLSEAIATELNALPWRSISMASPQAMLATIVRTVKS